MTADRLRGQKCANSLLDGGPAILADRFPNHFAKKIDPMHSQIRMPSANVFNAQTCVVLSPLLAFQSASLEEVTSLIQNGKMKTIHYLHYSEVKCRPLGADSQECHQSIVRVIYCSGKHNRRCHHASSKAFRSFRRILRQLPTCLELERHLSAQLRLHRQCNAMQYNAMQCNAMQCNAMQCNAMQCNAMQ